MQHREGGSHLGSTVEGGRGGGGGRGHCAQGEPERNRAGKGEAAGEHGPGLLIGGAQPWEAAGIVWDTLGPSWGLGQSWQCRSEGWQRVPCPKSLGPVCLSPSQVDSAGSGGRKAEEVTVLSPHFRGVAAGNL